MDIEYHGESILELQNNPEYKIYYMNTWIDKDSGIIEKQVSMLVNKSTGTGVIYGFNKGVSDSFLFTTNPEEIKNLKEGNYIKRYLMQLNLAIILK